MRIHSTHLIPAVKSGIIKKKKKSGIKILLMIGWIKKEPLWKEYCIFSNGRIWIRHSSSMVKAPPPAFLILLKIYYYLCRFLGLYSYIYITNVLYTVWIGFFLFSQGFIFIRFFFPRLLSWTKTKRHTLTNYIFIIHIFLLKAYFYSKHNCVFIDDKIGKKATHFPVLVLYIDRCIR